MHKYTTLLVAFLFLVLSAIPSHSADKPLVITLTQTPCIIIESEVTPKEYVSTQYSDCVAINKKTLPDRKFKPLHLKPGKTVFRVTNKNVPYDLGFWVRGQGLSRLTLPTVSGGGLATGATKDYEINLKPGRYYYSCPLNPTPDYTLVVE